MFFTVYFSMCNVWFISFLHCWQSNVELNMFKWTTFPKPTWSWKFARHYSMKLRQQKLCKHQLGSATLPFLVNPKHPKCALGVLQSCFTSSFVFQDTEMAPTAWGEGREAGGRQAAARPATTLPCCHRPLWKVLMLLILCPILHFYGRWV